MTFDTELGPGRSRHLTMASLNLHSPVLFTGRLLLRPPHLDDAAEIARLANNIAVAGMLVTMPHPYFAEDAVEFVESCARLPGSCVYAITLAETGRFIGICGIHQDSARHAVPFIGFWLGEPFWGLGYATEAARAMLDLFFKVTDRDSIMISCRRDNAASRRVIEKCGAHFSHADLQFVSALGEMHEADHYVITRAGWLADAENAN